MAKHQIRNHSTNSKQTFARRAGKHAVELLMQSSSAAMRSMRALDYEVQSEGSDDVIAMRVAEVVSELAKVVRNVGYNPESAQIESAAKDIQTELGKRYGMKPNSRRERSLDGLSDDPILLKAYCEMATESMELENWKDAEPNDEVRALAAEYDEELKKALADLVEKYPPENDATAEDLWAANAAYLVLMTLRGEGVGIWDGDWTDFYEDTDKAEAFLKKRLGKYADDTGSGKLEDAFREAAIESCGEPDDDSDEDDEDDED